MTLTFEQLPYVYQIEALAHVVWWAQMGTQTTYQQLEDAVKQESLKVWQEEKYDQNNVNNVLMHLTRNNSVRSTVAVVLNRLLNYRKNSFLGKQSFGDNTDDNYRRQNGRWIPLMNKVYQEQVDKNQTLQTQLTQAQQQIQQTGQQQQTTITELQNQIASLNQQLVQANNTNSQLQQENNELWEQLTSVQMETKIVQQPPK